MLMFAVVAFLILPAQANGQACFGIPQGSTSALALGFGFPSHAKTYSIGGLTEVGAGGYLSASYGLTSPDFAGLRSATKYGVQAGYELRGVNESASLCPSIGWAYEKWDGINTVQIPIGLAIGKTFSVGEGTDVTLTPSLNPHLLWARASYLDESNSESFFALNAGAALGIGAFFVNGSIAKVFEKGIDAVFSLGLGVRM